MPKLAGKIKSGITFENKSLAEPCRTIPKYTAEYRTYHALREEQKRNVNHSCQDSEFRAKQKSSLQSTRRF